MWAKSIPYYDYILAGKRSNAADLLGFRAVGEMEVCITVYYTFFTRLLIASAWDFDQKLGNSF